MSDRRIGAISVPAALFIVLAAGVLAALAILYLTRGFVFFYDEWSFVLGGSSWGPADFFLPHNEHWSTFPQVIYWVLLHLFGTRRYLPFMGVLMACHVASSLLLFALLRRRAGDLPALGAALALLVLGAGWEDLVWAFQVGFYGSVALGLAALVLLEARRPTSLTRAAAATALLLSVASSGAGLFFLAAIAVQLLASRAPKRDLLVILPAVAAYGAWFLAVGRHAAGSERNPLTMSALLSLRDYAPAGLGSAVAGLVALDASWAPLGLLALAGVTGWLLASPQARPRVLGAAGGLATMYVLLALVRGEYGTVQAGSSRYILIASVFLLLIAAEAASRLRWRSAWPIALALVEAVVLIANANMLVADTHARRGLVAITALDVATVNAFRAAPGLDRLARPDPIWMPQVRVGDLLATEAMFGQIVAPADPDALPVGGEQQIDSVLRQILPLHLIPVASPPRCASPFGQSQLAELSLAPGTRLEITGTAPGPVDVWLWAYASNPGAADARWMLQPGVSYLVVLPDPGRRLKWHLGLAAPPSDRVAECPATS